MRLLPRCRSDGAGGVTSVVGARPRGPVVAGCRRHVGRRAARRRGPGEAQCGQQRQDDGHQYRGGEGPDAAGAGGGARLTATPEQIAEAVASMLTAVLRQDSTSLTVDALHRGVLLAGGCALRPELTCHLAGRLHVPLRVVPAPHTAAVRGAAKLLQAAHTHPSTRRPVEDRHPG